MAYAMDLFTQATGGWRQRNGKISPDEYRRLRAACVVMATQSMSPVERDRWLGMAESIDYLIPESQIGGGLKAGR
jgi:hypothetical protein